MCSQWYRAVQYKTLMHMQCDTCMGKINDTLWTYKKTPIRRLIFVVKEAISRKKWHTCVYHNKGLVANWIVKFISKTVCKNCGFVRLCSCVSLLNICVPERWYVCNICVLAICTHDCSCKPWLFASHSPTGLSYIFLPRGLCLLYNI